MSRFTIGPIEPDEERCKRLARFLTWAGVMAIVLAVDLIFFGDNAPDATVFLALAVTAIGIAETALAGKGDDADRRISVRALTKVSFPVYEVTVAALVTLSGIEAALRSGIWAGAIAAIAAFGVAPACFSTAEYYRNRSKRESLARVMQSVRRIDVVIPIQDFVGNKFTIGEARLRIDTRNPFDVLLEKLVPALKLDDVSVEPDHLEVVARPLGCRELVERLSRSGITIDEPLNEAALTAGVVLAAHA